MRHHAKPLLVPGARPLLAASLIGRMPLGMTGLSMVLLLRMEGFGFAQTGIVLAIETIAVAGVGPWVGRLVDDIGQTRVLVALGILWPATVTLLVLAAAAQQLAFVLISAAAVGAALPPLSACLRTAWPALLTTPDLRQQAFALDATIQEAIFLSGPLTVGVLTTLASPRAAIACAALAGGAGTLMFAATGASRRLDRVGSLRRARGARPLRVGGVRTVALTFVGFGATWTTLTLTLAAIGEERGAGPQAALGMAAYALGSMAGGLWASTHPPIGSTRRRLWRMIVLGVLLLTPLLVVHGLAALLVVMTLAGIPLAPALGSAYTLIGRLSPEETVTEAFMWLNSAVFAGGALGGGVGGALLDAGGATAGVLLLIAFMATAAGAVAIGWHGLEP